MLSAAVQKATGQTVLDYLKPRLFDPLGIEQPTWEMSPQGISTGGFGLSIRTEDIAKFGQLYLQKGQWDGKKLVPSAWIAEATARQTSNGSSPTSDWDQGYGYQFWRCRHGAYRGDGAHGQFCVVLPEQDAVIAITSGTRDLQGVLNVIWDKLLPAFEGEPLAANEMANKALVAAMKGLTLKTPAGTASPAAAAVKTYTFEKNGAKLETLTLRTGRDGTALVCKIDGAERTIPVGNGSWSKGKAAWGRLTEQPAAAAGAWTADNVFTAKICFTETPFVATLRLTFSGNEVKVDPEFNVPVGGAAKEAALVGKAE
jgi:CubicO group peptidase (beta-lactamase class C family)